MTTFSRKMRRAACKRSGAKWQRREQPFIVRKDGGYRTLRPTKGWITISGKRLAAQRRMAGVLA